MSVGRWIHSGINNRVATLDNQLRAAETEHTLRRDILYEERRSDGERLALHGDERRFGVQWDLAMPDLNTV